MSGSADASPRHGPSPTPTSLSPSIAWAFWKAEQFALSAGLAHPIGRSRPLPIVRNQAMTPLPDYLHQAAKARTAEADTGARTALAQMVKTGQAVSFTALARTAGVSTDFLYRHPDL